MHYIRFLKPPRIDKDAAKAVVTITSDLGESFFPDYLQLEAQLLSANDEKLVHARQTLNWEPGLRALQVALRIDAPKVQWPATIRVASNCTPDLPYDLFEDGVNGKNQPYVISAWSDVLDPSRGMLEASRTIERRFCLPRNPTLSIWEETGESIARHIWDAGLTLAAHLHRRIGQMANDFAEIEQDEELLGPMGLQAIELGAGCGIVGLSLAQLIPDCTVFLTDLPEAEDIATRNSRAMKRVGRSQAQFIEFNWDDELPRPVRSNVMDLILVSDCTYNPDSAPALVKALSALVKHSPDAQILLAMKIRHESELVFFDLMEQAGFVERRRDIVKVRDAWGDATEKVQLHVFRLRDVTYDDEHMKRRILVDRLLMGGEWQ